MFLRYHAHAPSFLTSEEEENKGIWCSYLEVNEASLPLIQLQIGSVPRQWKCKKDEFRGAIFVHCFSWHLLYVIIGLILQWCDLVVIIHTLFLCNCTKVQHFSKIINYVFIFFVWNIWIRFDIQTSVIGICNMTNWWGIR